MIVVYGLQVFEVNYVVKDPDTGRSWRVHTNTNEFIFDYLPSWDTVNRWIKNTANDNRIKTAVEI